MEDTVKPRSSRLRTVGQSKCMMDGYFWLCVLLLRSAAELTAVGRHAALDGNFSTDLANVLHESSATLSVIDRP